MGEPTTPPLVPLFDGSPSCVYYQNNWVGLQHRTTETALTPSTRRADKPKLSTYMFYPRLRWKDVASTAQLVLGTPWLNPSNGKVAKSKIGAGFVVSVDSPLPITVVGKILVIIRLNHFLLIINTTIMSRLIT